MTHTKREDIFYLGKGKLKNRESKSKNRKIEKPPTCK